MKKIIIALGLVIGVSTSIISQNIYLKKTELDKVLCKNWDVDHAIMSGLTIKKLAVNADFEIEFNLDGTFEIYKETGEVREGLWLFNSKKHYVVLVENDEPIGIVKSCRKGILDIQFSSEKDDSAIANLEVFLKPL
ncbi:hypothetical protein SAMN05444411_10513 [Lutibacter oricola]|uniref:Lipocalin-like domain-containing protein n=1 Tax=Lutibacter oricola TaxID=762486 RepID=A0A1H3B3T6_9FLAO|nr:hypothetical protein [Lutibacter oricola]SDX36616.1 hypothetical protein SAMN05444411_10513 [Lutibacter oricola]